MPFNLDAPDFSFLDGYRKILLFSCWTIHMCPNIAEDFFDRLAALGVEVRMVFIEPIGFQLPPQTSLSEQQIKALDARFNRTFASILGEALRRRVIEVSFMGKDLFGDNLFDLLSVVVARIPPKG